MVQMMNYFRNAGFKRQILISVFALACYAFTSHILEESYAQSQFPVPYFKQQTSFDATMMKQWYAYMLERNTMHIYLKTQFIDFVFIASVIIAGYAVWTLIANLHNNGNFFNTFGHIMAFALPLAGLFDVFENLVSFPMIADPLHFSDWWILPYSSFATIKFMFWSVGLLWLSVSLIALLLNKFLKRI